MQETIFASNNLQGPDEDLARILEKQNPARNHVRFLRSREEQDRCFSRLLRPKRLTLNSKNRKRKKNEKGFGKEQNVKGSISRGEWKWERERESKAQSSVFFFFWGGSDFLSLKPSFFFFSFFLSLPDLNYKFLSFLLDSTIKWDRQKNPFLSKSLSFSFSFFIFPFSTTQKISQQSRAFFILLCFFICVHFFFFLISYLFYFKKTLFLGVFLFFFDSKKESSCKFCFLKLEKRNYILVIC